MEGKGSKQALANNDEISFVVPKNKGFFAVFINTPKMVLFLMFISRILCLSEFVCNFVTGLNINLCLNLVEFLVRIKFEAREQIR